MKTIRVAHRGFLFLATAFAGLCVLGSAFGIACSSPEKAGGEGAQCAVFTDCAGGLFCVPVGSQMLCSADAAALVMIEEAGAAPQAEAGAAPSGDGASGSSGGDASMGPGPVDDASAGPDANGTTGMAEASSPPPVDDAAPAAEAAPPSPDDAGDEP